jgi:BNR repeat-like domain
VLPFGPFVIGVHVVADERDPNTFYAVWLDTLTGALDGTGKSPYMFAKTTDGARTWQPAREIARAQQIPNIFPRQSFRNLSLPIMAAGPRGELYVTYADYNPAPDPATDEDGMQADIKIITSFDGGATWSDPRRVNQDVTNADQFQPYVRVTPRGQVDVSFFDRRLDRPDPPNHPGNFFIDTFLARSDSRGARWRETRISHDSWDPSINPPTSPSGAFIGDYQGLVADDCFAIPFVNDTHLANDRRRDPDFDRGEPRSRFQQIVSWRVPNLAQFGGTDTRARTCRSDRDRRLGGRVHRAEPNRARAVSATRQSATARRADPARVARGRRVSP